MSNDQEIGSQVRELFDKLIRSNQTIEDINELGDHLPSNRSVLRHLAARCLEESRKAVHAGHHTEGRRLGILGRQLQERISG